MSSSNDSSILDLTNFFTRQEAIAFIRDHAEQYAPVVFKVCPVNPSSQKAAIGVFTDEQSEHAVCFIHNAGHWKQFVQLAIRIAEGASHAAY